MFQLKAYQSKTLSALERYLKQARIVGAKEAYFTVKGSNTIPYHVIDDLEETPYVCLRLPTGGGKTFLSAYSIRIIAQTFVEKDFPMVIWFTPTTTIKEQTLKTLKNPKHPNREILDVAFNGNVAIFDIDDFANIRPHDIKNKACIFVSTIQSFNVKNTEKRNIYAHNENLEPHFVNIPQHFIPNLEKIEAGQENEGKVKNSFANLLNINNPIVIVDEAHKAVTELNRKIMRRINPSCILEFTATPNKKESNVLYRVNAIELKLEDMIKLPIILTENQTWQQSLTASCLMRNKLAEIAKLEKEYIRPIVLIQSESKGQENTEDVVKQYLIDNENIPAENIAIVTGEQKELEGINVLDKNCPIEYIITKQALKEGWDCPFAYIFCSVAQVHSLTSVEQFLGRVLRMPYAKKREHEELNKAYTFVSSSCWTNSVAKLKDSLVSMGFNEQETTNILQPTPVEIPFSFTFTVTEDIPNNYFTDEEKEEMGMTKEQKIENGQITIQIKRNMSNELKNKLSKIITSKDLPLFETTCNVVSTKKESFSQMGEKFEVPQLCLFEDDIWNVIDDREVYLQDGFKLLDYTAVLTEADFSIKQEGKVFSIDIDGKRITERFLNVNLMDEVDNAQSNWTNSTLSQWLDRKTPQQDVSQPVLLEFIRRIIDNLTTARQIPLNSLVRTKFLLSKAIDTKISKYREEAYKKGFQALLFKNENVETKLDFSFQFIKDYFISNLYSSDKIFNKHYYSSIGAMNKEEAECAQVIDGLPEVKYWVRNVERHLNSFSLPTSTDKFYPDFICLLNDGRLLAVEYKGEHLISADDAKEKENIGSLWAKKSNGKCLFLMVTKSDYEAKIKNIVK